MNQILCLYSRTINKKKRRVDDTHAQTHSHSELEWERRRHNKIHTIVAIHMDSMSAMKTENRATSFRLCNRKHSVMKTKYRSNWVEMMHLHFHTLVCERARVYSLARSRSNSTTFVFYKHFRDFSGARFCRFRFFSGWLFFFACHFNVVEHNFRELDKRWHIQHTFHSRELHCFYSSSSTRFPVFQLQMIRFSKPKNKLGFYVWVCMCENCLLCLNCSEWMLHACKTIVERNFWLHFRVWPIL